MKKQRRQFVMGFIAYVVQRGVGAEQLCNEAGIRLESIVQDEEAEITDAKLHRLWTAATTLTDDLLFGLHFGEAFQLPALGAVGEIIKSSETVGKALTIAATFTPVVTTMYTMLVERNNQSISVKFVPTREEPADINQQVADFLMVFTVHELAGFLLKKVSPTSISYPFKIKSPREYERVFNCAPVRHDELKVEFDASWWEEPIITANYEVQQFFLEKMVATKQADSASSFQARIMDYLLTNSYHGIPSLEDVAANFNLTTRSLQRRLQDEATTFQQTADAVRKTLAVHYLESGKYKIKEISNLLGYNEISAFSRAFKRWTGKTPVDYSA
jgi:AraC-like DNA-binding protein